MPPSDSDVKRSKRRTTESKGPDWLIGELWTRSAAGTPNGASSDSCDQLLLRALVRLGKLLLPKRRSRQEFIPSTVSRDSKVQTDRNRKSGTLEFPISTSEADRNSRNPNAGFRQAELLAYTFRVGDGL